MVIVGLVAAFFAWIFNSLALHWLGKKAIYTLAPIAEELFKTGLAYLTGSALLTVHLTFGLAEAVYDVLRPGKDDLPAGLLGLISHGLYGWLTQELWTRTGNLTWGLLAAIFIHLLWNWTVMFFFRQGPGSKTR